jgi:hypothetical protein
MSDVGEAGEDGQEQIPMLDEIRLAERQIACGEGLEHEDARARILARLGLEPRPHSS